MGTHWNKHCGYIYKDVGYRTEEIFVVENIRERRIKLYIEICAGKDASWSTRRVGALLVQVWRLWLNGLILTYTYIQAIEDYKKRIGRNDQSTCNSPSREECTIPVVESWFSHGTPYSAVEHHTDQNDPNDYLLLIMTDEMLVLDTLDSGNSPFIL
jgi:hypothetical protein